ncbi:MAG: two-component system sensor histidine kinase NtrB [Fibrobacterota bacterium]
MQISSILLVGIFSPALQISLNKNGYGTITVENPDDITDLEQDISLVIIDQSCLHNHQIHNTERLYFLSGMKPIIILLHSLDQLQPSLQSLIHEGTFDYIYDHEIESGLAIKRIEKSYIYSRTDLYLRCAQKDVEECRRLEQELSMRAQILQHEQEISASILSSIGHGLLLFDESHTIVVANQRAHDLIGGKKSLLGCSPTTLHGNIRSVIESFIQHESPLDHTIPSRQCNHDGRILALSAFPLINCPHASGTLVIINDITEQESINLQLYRAEKLATVGTMLSGVAHELRNPLSIISGRTQLVSQKLTAEAQEWISSYLNTIDQQVRRCAHIVNKILDFTRITTNRHLSCNASELLETALGYLSYQYSDPDIKISKMYDKCLTVFGDQSRLIQLFLNIMSNAVQAMDGKGCLSLSCSLIEENYGLITIADTGPGISPEDGKKIFDPFFTTKDPGQGTGLGLSIANKIAHQSGGRLWFTSHPGDTRFFVRLPSFDSQKP